MSPLEGQLLASTPTPLSTYPQRGLGGDQDVLVLNVPPPPTPTVRWQGGRGGEVAQEVTDVPAFRALGNLFKISDASYPKIIS